MSLLDLSAAELIARGIAPIKKDYRLGAIRYTTKPDLPAAAPAGDTAAAAAAATDDKALEAAGASKPGPVVAADGDGGHKRVKSKKQRRKVRAGSPTVCDVACSPACCSHLLPAASTGAP